MATHTIVLESDDVLQLLDALRSRLESWQATKTYLKSGEHPVEFGIAEDCSDINEAAEIIEHYSDLVTRIERQFRTE